MKQQVPKAPSSFQGSVVALFLIFIKCILVRLNLRTASLNWLQVSSFTFCGTLPALKNDSLSASTSFICCWMPLWLSETFSAILAIEAIISCFLQIFLVDLFQFLEVFLSAMVHGLSGGTEFSQISSRCSFATGPMSSFKSCEAFAVPWTLYLESGSLAKASARSTNFCFSSRLCLKSRSRNSRFRWRKS